MQEGSTILLSTPYMDEAERCGRVGFLLDGRLIACGSPAALRNELGTVILDLRCADSRAARRTLRRVAGLSERRVIFGDHLHVTVPRHGFDVSARCRRARAAGVEVLDWPHPRAVVGGCLSRLHPGRERELPCDCVLSTAFESLSTNGSGCI